jgi:hypothetical protein
VPQDAACGEETGGGRLVELIVGRAGDGGAPQERHRARGQQAIYQHTHNQVLEPLTP